MGHPLSNNLRLPRQRPADLSAVTGSSAPVVAEEKPSDTACPEALIRTFKHQAKLLELLENKLGPEGQALRSALTEAQSILNELLEKQLGDDEI